MDFRLCVEVYHVLKRVRSTANPRFNYDNSMLFARCSMSHSSGCQREHVKAGQTTQPKPSHQHYIFRRTPESTNREMNKAVNASQTGRVPNTPRYLKTHYLSPVSPTARAGSRAAQFDVYDGKGQITCSANSFYLSLVRSMHPRYKAADGGAEKTVIAATIYDAIVREGGRFFDKNGKLKSKTEAMKKIKKSLKDMKQKPHSADIVDDASVERVPVPSGGRFVPPPALPRMDDYPSCGGSVPPPVPRPLSLSTRDYSLSETWKTEQDFEWVLQLLSLLQCDDAP
jgi:hypothetical protein